MVIFSASNTNCSFTGHHFEKVQQLFEFEGYPRMGRPNFIFGVQPINKDF